MFSERVRFEFAALFEKVLEVFKEQDEVGEQGQQPEGGSCFGHLLVVEAEYLDLGKDVQVVKDPVQSEKAPYQYIEHVVNSALLPPKVSNFLALVHRLEQAEQLPRVTHVR